MLTDALKPKASRVIGIDASTNSIAFAVIEDGKLLRFGEIALTGNDVYSRMLDARKKMAALAGEFRCDYLAIEAPVVVRSSAVAIKMAYVFGAVICQLLDDGVEVKEVYPIQWQSYIGNKLLTKAEKEEIKKQNPKASASKLKTLQREVRKNATKSWVRNTFSVEVPNDNLSDAIGISFYASNHLTKR